MNYNKIKCIGKKNSNRYESTRIKKNTCYNTLKHSLKFTYSDYNLNKVYLLILKYKGKKQQFIID